MNVPKSTNKNQKMANVLTPMIGTYNLLPKLNEEKLNLSCPLNDKSRKNALIFKETALHTCSACNYDYDCSYEL